MRRFEPEGRYYPLLATNQKVDFVVLKYTLESVRKKHPGMSFAVHVLCHGV